MYGQTASTYLAMAPSEQYVQTLGEWTNRWDTRVKRETINKLGS